MQKVLLFLLYFYSFLASASDTVLKLYRPFDEVIHQAGSQLSKKRIGECATQSQRILREDAWRCEAEGVIYDPCFMPMADKSSVLTCPVSPWSAENVEITRKNTATNASHITLDMSRAYPWAIELANGEKCLATESGETYDSMPIRYRCSGENVLIGYLQRCKPVWSMLEKTPTGVASVDFVKVWF